MGLCRSFGAEISMRYWDMISKVTVEETRTADEIISSIKAGLKKASEE